MTKKIIAIILLVACAWFFVDRTLNYGAVNNRRTEEAQYQRRLHWMDYR